MGRRRLRAGARAPRRGPRRRARHHQPHRRRADAAPALPRLRSRWRSAAGIHRVTVCTNGIRLAKDEALVERLARARARGSRCRSTRSSATPTARSRARELVDAEAALPGAAREARRRHHADPGDDARRTTTTRSAGSSSSGCALRCVRHIEVHTMTFTGQGGDELRPLRPDLDVRGARAHRGDHGRPAAARATSCRRRARTRSATRSRTCCSIPRAGRRCRSRASSPARRCTTRCRDRLYLEPTARLEARLQDAIDRLWARDEPGDGARPCGCSAPARASCSRRRIRSTPDEALRVSERAVKAVYVHSHMDEETFDVERAVECCDSNCYADGTHDPGVQLQRAVPREGGDAS